MVITWPSWKMQPGRQRANAAGANGVQGTGARGAEQNGLVSHLDAQFA